MERAEKGEKLKRWNISLISSRDLRGVLASGTCREEKNKKHRIISCQGSSELSCSVIIFSIKMCQLQVKFLNLNGIYSLSLFFFNLI